MRIALAIGYCLLAVLPARAQFPPPGAKFPSTAQGPAAPGTSLSSLSAASQPAANAHPAVCRIVAPGDGSVSYGSGTLVQAADAYGLVVTNWHVVNEATGPISVHFPDGFYSLGTVQNVDRDWDLAVLAIKKPNATPVAIAAEPPRQGEVLTIAGYGAGTYRAASGPCTQYVAPGVEFPYEMVEVAVSARQGDSGGPIFNQRGELAGVLFGEGHGRTSGSYCGRVRWFLTSVAPSRSAMSTIAAARPLEPIPSRPASITTPNQSSAFGEPGAASTSAAVAQSVPQSPASVSPASPWPVVSATSESVPVVASTQAASGSAAHAVQIGWHDIAGETFGEQAKTVLAAVGTLAILLQALKWLSRNEAAT